MHNTFRALILREKGAAGTIEALPKDDLPPGDILVRVAYSSLNYKDGLAVTGKPGVVRSYPMVPGIDFSGTVEESNSPDFHPGDHVVVTGCGMGEQHWGGYAQMARLNPEWLVKLPPGISLRHAMGIGTAGFTAMQSVMALEEHGATPGGREIAVTGAAGGLGGVAIAILAKLGYRVVASSGRAETYQYLKALGAHEIIDRSVLAASSKRPLESERWGGAIDSVGGETLAGLLRGMAVGTSVAVCGLAGGAAVNTTVLPFILRGVNLLGIDSVRTVPQRRRAVWARLAQDLPMESLDRMIQVAPLGDVTSLGDAILQGRVRGRTVIDVNAD